MKTTNKGDSTTERQARILPVLALSLLYGPRNRRRPPHSWNGATSQVTPMKAQLRETEQNYPVNPPRWETPKSTIQLEDLLFIGSQFNDTMFPPGRLSLAQDPEPCAAVQTATKKATWEMSPLLDGCRVHNEGEKEVDAYESDETLVLLENGEDSSRLPLLVKEKLPESHTTTGKSKSGSYLRSLPKNLASTMRRVLAGVWDMVRWKSLT
ncbi:hypothetical protein PG993_014721 [Apiospora rasikravindrae]|uniref:Uncharacterized protein n=1 Tax=Apiospora rasikravindrae TaxID=990691 RepID=A0ABR1RNR8_9PEZI